MRQLLDWLPFGVISTLFCLLVYVAVQQDLRQAADDPQIQMAEDAAARLRAGADPKEIVPRRVVDIRTSLAPYLIVFDDRNEPVVGNARLNGRLPTVPSGALEHARTNGQNRVTWRPEPGARQAIVITPAAGTPWTVVAGRSLREQEARQARLVRMIGLLWLTIIILSFGSVALRRVAAEPPVGGGPAAEPSR